MLLVDLREARLELPDLERQLEVGFPERVEFGGVRGLRGAEVGPFLAELVLRAPDPSIWVRHLGQVERTHQHHRGYPDLQRLAHELVHLVLRLRIPLQFFCVGLPYPVPEKQRVSLVSPPRLPAINGAGLTAYTSNKPFLRNSIRSSNSSVRRYGSLRLRRAMAKRKTASTPSAKTRSKTDETSSRGKR